MDRFADRRFDGFRQLLDESSASNNLFANRNDILVSPVFNDLLPARVRWVADGRGHIIAVGQDAVPFPIDMAVDPVGRGWRKLLNAADRRALIAMARQDRPDPLTIRLRGVDGQRRWCLVRITKSAATDGAARYYGMVEDVHDCHDRHARALETALAESREHYRWSVELSPQVPWTASPDGNIEEVGPLWETLTGLTREQTLGSGWTTAVHPDDLAHVVSVWEVNLTSGDPVDVDYRARLRDGSYRWMRSRAAARLGMGGKIIRWYGTLEDVHAQKLAQQALYNSEERLRLAVQSAKLGIWDFDVATGARTWSAELRAMLGLAEDQPATSELALSLVHPEDRHILGGMLAAVASGTAPLHFEATLRIERADDGALRVIKSRGWTTLSEQGRPLRIVVTFLDITEEHDVEQRIRWAATHDPMTRLPNRALWQARLEDMARDAKEQGAHFGLMLLDIDDLKRINDSLGHDAGDALLCDFAKRLAAMAPPDALLGRLGGDEFGLIAPSLADSAAMEAWSAKLTANLRQRHVHRGRSLDCGVSMGGALSGDHGEVAAELLKAADLALYSSKAVGRGRLTLFHSELRAEAQQRSSMIRMARQVVAENLIIPYYQPKIDMRSGRVLGHEALLRWRHPRLGVQLPGSIVAAFDHGELAAALTRRMLDAVLRDMRRWLDTGFDPGRIALNASAADFMQDDFVDSVLEQLSRYDIPPCHVEIEVVETVFLGRGADHVACALRGFAQAGVRIALDDFGTGYASLSHLKHYPVDVLKIDRSFISNITQDAGDAAIVDAVVKLGSSLGMEVVAEGVETAEQAELLLGHGCFIGQGFLLGRPQPFADIRPLRAE